MLFAVAWKAETACGVWVLSSDEFSLERLALWIMRRGKVHYCLLGKTLANVNLGWENPSAVIL